MSPDTNNNSNNNPTEPVLSLDELVLQRRRIYSALVPFFELESLLDAMWIWEEDYVGGGEQVLGGFVNRICQAEMDRMEASILTSLTSYWTSEDLGLRDDPYDLMLARRSGHLNLEQSSPEEGKDDGNLAVFNGVLQRLFYRLEVDNLYHTDQLCRYVEANLASYRVGLSVEQVKELQQWLKRPKQKLVLYYTSKQISSILHLLSVGVAEFFGPEKSDRYMAEAVNSPN